MESLDLLSLTIKNKGSINNKGSVVLTVLGHLSTPPALSNEMLNCETKTSPSVKIFFLPCVPLFPTQVQF